MNYFLDTAHAMVTQSLRDSDEGNYLLSWMRSSSSRVYFLADTVISTAILPLSLIKLTFSATQSVYTWGHRGDFWKNASLVDQHISRICLSVLGANLSPVIAYGLRDAKIVENLCSLSMRLLPNRISFKIPGTILTGGWNVPRQAAAH